MVKLHGRTVALLVTGCAALFATGCGVHNTSTPPTSASIPPLGAATSTSSSIPQSSSASIVGTDVTVVETEYHLAFSSLTFTAGEYTFTAENKGQIVHALAVTGPGVSATTPDLNPGETANLVVTLKAGSYDVFCPIPGHKALGMNQEITVTG